MTRLRVSRIVVQVEAFADDGDTLTPVPTTPVAVSFAEWDGFDLHAAIASLRAQFEGQPDPPPASA